MIYDLIKASWKPLIFIALVSLTITWAFNIENTMITTEYINNIQIKRFNIHTYMVNISNAWETVALNFQTIIPTRTFEAVTGNMLQEQFWNTLFNNILCAFDWIYFPINFILYILRWVAWLINILLSIIGWNTQQRQDGTYYSTLAMILNWIKSNLVIPYL